MKPAVLVPALVLLAAVAGAPAWAQSVVPKGVQLHARQELLRSNAVEPESLDPAQSETINSAAIVLDLFEGLTATDNGGRIVPGVALSWKQTNPKTWLFALRKDARFSNGDPVTAADFVYAWQRFVDPKTASVYATTFGQFLLNGNEVAAGKKPPTELGVKALDPYTLEVRTSVPVPYMPGLVANPQFCPLHKASLEKAGKDWTKPGNMVGNGAYVLKEARVNARIVLEKNPKYWDAANVNLTKVTYLPIEDPNADVKMFQSGESDWVAQLPPGTYDGLKAAYPQDIRNTPLLANRFYPLNNSDPLLKDVRVRKALSMVIDRDVLAAKVTADGQLPLYGLMVKGLSGAEVSNYDWAAWPMAQRVAEAKKLLAAAGVAPGTKLHLSYNTSDYHKRMAIFIASEWKTKLGLEVSMDNMELKVLVKKMHDGEFQIARYGWYADYNDATSFYTLVKCADDQNFNRNCNKKADELVDQANQLDDPAKRTAQITQAAKLVMEDYPFIPLLQNTLPRLVKSYVGGYDERNALARFRSRDLYIIKH
jgi:oligopeptide transport system substrate-binding protein